jgi:uncharacterized protein YpmB
MEKHNLMILLAVIAVFIIIIALIVYYKKTHKPKHESKWSKIEKLFHIMFWWV